MPRKPERLPYRIVAAYDSETTNIVSGASKRAFPILHQLGVLSAPIEQVGADNVESCTRIEMYRHALELYSALDSLAASASGYVPVVLCHNLAFDMYGLADYFRAKQAEGITVKVLAKSVRKPITFTVCDDDGGARLVIWDTLVFSQKSLAYMGAECGYSKLSGDWDYNLVRTCDTPLTERERAYAAHDVYALLAWMGHWCRLNPDIPPEKLGFNVVTKTGVVRQRRYLRFGHLRGQGNGNRLSVGDYWVRQNQAESFTTDNELYTFNACTRGGFTFCSAEHASEVFDYSQDAARAVYGYDATSQHPSQIVSHKYPEKFHQVSADVMRTSFRIVARKTVENVLKSYAKPFPVAFCGQFKFRNLRLKNGSIFEREGIAPLASARFAPYKSDTEVLEGNQDAEEFKEHMAESYRDTVQNPTFAFGKLLAADYCEIYLTELAAWEVSQAYEWDSMDACGPGYQTGRFVRPTDMAVISVMQFYGGKNAFKKARNYYYKHERLPEPLRKKLLDHGIPEFVVSGMDAGTIDEQTVESTYLGLKADLNALFGIEASNEYRRDTVLSDTGIAYEGDFGVQNAPKTPKAWYQCGQRIVGWSRIAQTLVLELCGPYADAIINGDTDSVKLVFTQDGKQCAEKALSRMEKSIDAAKRTVCARVRAKYPEQYVPLDGIGYYVEEFATDRFCAAWNKAYVYDDAGQLRFTIAGVPVNHREKGPDGKPMHPSVSDTAQWAYGHGEPFGEICDNYLGYNVTYPHTLTGLNARSFPAWGDMCTGRVIDYRGHESMVAEPSALCLYGMPKTVNDTHVPENHLNMAYALRNRPSVNTEPQILTDNGWVKVGELLGQI